MVSQKEPRRMAVEEWWALLDHNPAAKYEYIDGWVSLMAGGSRVHARIGMNAIRALEDALEGRPCWVYNSDMATRLSATRYTFPDASVTCDARDRPTVEDREIVAPRLIVEVISDTTEAYDRGDKFSYYQACPSVWDYVLIATKRQSVEVYRRTAQGWTSYQRYGPDDIMQCVSIDARISVAALYRLTDVPREVEQPEGEV